MDNYTFSQLQKMTCRSFGGNNCVLHGCMFECQLYEAKIKAIMKEKNLSEDQAKEYLKGVE